MWAFIRMMTSTPARLMPRSSMSERIQRPRCTSCGEYMRMFPRERAGSMSPVRSYARRVCACTPTIRAATLMT